MRTDRQNNEANRCVSHLDERAWKRLDIGSVYTLFVATLLDVLAPYWWENSVITCTCCCL